MKQKLPKARAMKTPRRTIGLVFGSRPSVCGFAHHQNQHLKLVFSICSLYQNIHFTGWIVMKINLNPNYGSVLTRYPLLHNLGQSNKPSKTPWEDRVCISVLASWIKLSKEANCWACPCDSQSSGATFTASAQVRPQLNPEWYAPGKVRINSPGF